MNESYSDEQSAQLLHSGRGWNKLIRQLQTEETGRCATGRMRVADANQQEKFERRRVKQPTSRGRSQPVAHESHSGGLCERCQVKGNSSTFSFLLPFHQQLPFSTTFSLLFNKMCAPARQLDHGRPLFLWQWEKGGRNRSETLVSPLLFPSPKNVVSLVHLDPKDQHISSKKNKMNEFHTQIQKKNKTNF